MVPKWWAEIIRLPGTGPLIIFLRWTQLQLTQAITRMPLTNFLSCVGYWGLNVCKLSLDCEVSISESFSTGRVLLTSSFFHNNKEEGGSEYLINVVHQIQIISGQPDGNS